MKLCSRCMTYQSKEEFHKTLQCKDGLSAWCKGCIRKKDADRERKKKYRGSETGKAIIRNTMRKWLFKNRKKAIAHGAVKQALKHKVLEIQPCRDCNSTSVMAHHPDYDRVFDVIWLCPQHHVDEHKKLAILEGKK